ncbi:leucine-rich repeat domain-containing protein [Fredinandcohnia sp. 179-A 10B2 NHS]|uniref:leucine-rich repeat domain-containing protein n=1 Tax=Fredinandcohnia sp. 179-A 10B2 NHS TaxID=3235176 RepID=UPI0039A3C6D7
MHKFTFINLVVTCTLLVTLLIPITTVGAESATGEPKMNTASPVVTKNINCDSNDPTCDTYQWNNLYAHTNYALDTSLSIKFGLIQENSNTDGLEYHIYVDGALKGKVPYQDVEGQYYQVDNLSPETDYEVEVQLVRNGEVVESDTFVAATVPTPLYFIDAGLEQAVKVSLGLFDRPLESSDINGMTGLYANGYGIKSIEGLEEATKLYFLDLNDNQITDVSPIENLTTLNYLYAQNNLLTDIQPISGLTNLQSLNLNGNQISDFAPIAGLTNLQWLGLEESGVTDLTFVTHLTKLVTLTVTHNHITELSPLKGLDQLYILNLGYNDISDISVLLEIPSLSMVDLSYNSLNEAAQNVINQLVTNGTRVYIEEEEPNAPSVYKWVQKSNKWYYEDQYCNKKTGWLLDGPWYFLDANGAMVENKWVQSGGLWYYLGKSGAMVTNSWVKSGGTWYYVDAKGVMLESKWIQSNGLWYFMGTGGGMVTNNWVYDKAWYFMDGNGVMVTNKWFNNAGSWYFMSKSGVMSTGWFYDGGAWYYLTPGNGKMVTGWKIIGGTWYYFYSNGEMAANTTIGGYKLNASGAWVR